MTIEEDILYLSKKAVYHDESGNIDAAQYFYKESLSLLKELNRTARIKNVSNKIDEYQKRLLELEALKNNIKNNLLQNNLAQNNGEVCLLDRINFMLQEALGFDERNKLREALQMYLEAAELCMKLKKESDSSLQQKLTSLATQAIERAEILKTTLSGKKINDEGIDLICNDLDSMMQPNDGMDNEPLHILEMVKSTKKRHSTYSTAELDVLRHTSMINGLKYPPFLEGIDDRSNNSAVSGERFSYVAKPFNDPDGLLRLAPKQLAHFQTWARPSEICVGTTSPTLFPPALLNMPPPTGNKNSIKGALKHNRSSAVYPALDWAAIRQTIISDCSFVASLTVCAHHEARFFAHLQSNSIPPSAKKRYRPLISNLIYPRDRAGLRSIYNPCGKYIVKLLLNGVPRKIVVDDKLPVDKYKFPLCSYSLNSTSKTQSNSQESSYTKDGYYISEGSGFCINEFWVSILEKAYVKVMGGYDFPGSNSNIDLHALTGWIPERVPILKEALEGSHTSQPDIISQDEDKLFEKLLKKFHQGDVLITLATGPLSDAESERTGLVSTHAYAMVDIRQVAGYKLFRLKNPWSHVRWKGNFSERDRKHWDDPILGPQLKKALSYDITKYTTVNSPLQNIRRDSVSDEINDDGLFWIDYKSVRQFFDVFYLNWDPLLFPYTSCCHDKWEPYISTTAGSSPIKDAYMVCHNPQYKLSIRRPANSENTANAPKINSAAIWILLTRHITEKDDFAQNKEFITLLVYDGGDKIYYPYDPPPLIDGVRINSPHYLCKMIVNFDENSSITTKDYTLVISEYEKHNTIYYTLRIYSTVEFGLEKIEDPYVYTKEFTHCWKGSNAGACTNHPETYHLNPCYMLKLQGDSNSSIYKKSQLNATAVNKQILITLKAPKEYCVGIDLYAFDKEQNRRVNKLTSGAFRSGFSVLKCDHSQMKNSQLFEIIPSTYVQGQEGPFILTIQSTCDFQAHLKP